MNIGKAAQLSGLSTKQIRYYESFGLITARQRADNGYRFYHEQDIEQLIFIKKSKALGFSLGQIQQLLQLWHNPQRMSMDVKHIVQQHLDDIESKISALNHMKHHLASLLPTCQGDQSPACPILNTLAGKPTNQR